MHRSDARVRLGRILWDLGYFVRISVPVSIPTKSLKNPRKPDITEIHALGIRFDTDFSPDYILGRIALNTDKFLDDLLWLRGMMHLLDAKKGILVVSSNTDGYRRFTNNMGVKVMDLEDLESLEKKATVPLGLADPHFVNEVVELRSDLKAFHTQLNYLIYRYWLEPDYSQIKKLISIGRNLSRESQSHSTAFKWLVSETIIRFVVSLCHLCGKVYLVKDRDMRAEISTQLSGGVLQRQERQELRNTLAELISRFSRQDLISIETALTLDPEYSAELAEIGWRLVNQSRITCQLPRFVDLLWYEFILKGKSISHSAVESIIPEREFLVLEKITRDIVEFFTSVTRLNPSLIREMLA